MYSGQIDGPKSVPNTAGLKSGRSRSVNTSNGMGCNPIQDECRPHKIDSRGSTYVWIHLSECMELLHTSRKSLRFDIAGTDHPPVCLNLGCYPVIKLLRSAGHDVKSECHQPFFDVGQ